MVNRRPKLELLIVDQRDRRSASPSASPAEAAAIVAALERFMRDTAPVVAPQPQALDPWLSAAMLEGVSRQIYGSRPPQPEPWLNT
jgi:hypothetical protein